MREKQQSVDRRREAVKERQTLEWPERTGGNGASGGMGNRVRYTSADRTEEPMGTMTRGPHQRPLGNLCFPGRWQADPGSGQGVVRIKCGRLQKRDP